MRPGFLKPLFLGAALAVPGSPDAAEPTASPVPVGRVAQGVKEKAEQFLAAADAPKDEKKGESKEEKEKVKFQNLWERADGPIKVGETVLVEIELPKDGKKDGKLEKYAVQVTLTSYGLAVQGQAFQMYADRLVFKNAAPFVVTISGAQKMTVKAADNKLVSMVRVSGIAAGTNGNAWFTKEYLKAMIEGFYRQEEPRFNLLKDDGQQLTTGFLRGIPVQKEK